MNFDVYQKAAGGTNTYNETLDRDIELLVMSNKLNGEAGEVAEKIAKVYRDNDGVFTRKLIYAIMIELGDVLWYVANIAAWFGFSMAKIAGLNILKVYGRKERGTLKGNGDNR